MGEKFGLPAKSREGSRGDLQYLPAGNGGSKADGLTSVSIASSISHMRILDKHPDPDCVQTRSREKLTGEERQSVMSVPVMNVRPVLMVVNHRFVDVLVTMRPMDGFHVAMVMT